MVAPRRPGRRNGSAEIPKRCRRPSCSRSCMQLASYISKMPKVPKMVPPGLKNRAPSPFIAWCRDYLMHIKRKTDLTPPAGIPGPDGECVYMPPNRFPNTQSSRSIEPAMAQGGVHHKLADNYYLDRDARRDVKPPMPVYKADGSVALLQGAVVGAPTTADKMDKDISAAFNKGPAQNFGLNFPTPGFGYEWEAQRRGRGVLAEEEPGTRQTREVRHVSEAAAMTRELISNSG
uniref:NADH dehydrogenase [ubiquinone] 1 alpha subcomplex subunit 7 n=1 Tax=Globodera rostochiensis TaxID=31243 RepID=A0A914GV25_GLORO